MTSNHDGQLEELIQQVLSTLEEYVVGQREAAEALLATWIAGGHALVQGVPGIGKTLLARCFAAVLGLDFNRVQFTPDLMPTDITGTNVFDQDSGGFRLVRGPVFTQILMADEVNRTPPKTQAALLEAMQERQVTIDGERHPLHHAFFVIATQNPIEFEGTYPLPEAQLDRFLARVEMTLPGREHELELFRRALEGKLDWTPEALPAPVMSPEQAVALRPGARSVHVAEELLDYLQRLAAGVRCSEQLELAVSPRAVLALLELGRASALIEGRDHVIPDDFKRNLSACWGHRLILTAEAELEGHSAAQILQRAAASVEVPR